MTTWALGFISTVRIGAGAWRKWANTRESGDTDQAGALNNHTQEPRNRRDPDRKLLEKEITGPSQEQNPGTVSIANSPLARATALHSVTLRAVTNTAKE
jgi:hypothetical protein